MKLPEEVIKVIQASCADSTWKQYQGVVNKWNKFCIEKGFDFWCINVEIFLLFLVQLFDSGLSYASVNTARSALSTLLSTKTSEKIGEHPLVIRFMKGVARLRPPKSRYDVTWDPTIMLSFFKSWPENDKLSLYQLTVKLCALMALTTAQRVQTLNAIHICNILWGDPIQIIFPSILKTTKINLQNPTLILPYFTECSKICVASTLKYYVSATAKLRSCQSLFISTKSPHKEVSTQTLSKWLCKALSLANIDISKFRGHSFRHAASSKAHTEGLNVDSIFKRAGWSSKSKVFARFYNRPIDDRAGLAEVILKSV